MLRGGIESYPPRFPSLVTLPANGVGYPGYDMKPTLLIVDDEPHLLRLFVRIFEREGFRVLTAVEGDAAIALFGAHSAEIVALVLDVIIPPRGAAEVLDAISSQKPGLGVVLISGDQLDAPLDARIAEGGGVFLRKPFLPNILTAAVRRVSGLAAP